MVPFFISLSLLYLYHLTPFLIVIKMREKQGKAKNEKPPKIFNPTFPQMHSAFCLLRLVDLYLDPASSLL